MAKTKILVPKVAEFFEDKVAGQRVDEALIRLTEELPNLKAADVAEVAGVPAASVGSSGVFFQTFETPVETTWTRRTDPTSYSYTANGQAGGKALNAVGEVAWEFPGNIPFNDDRLYRIRARFRMTAAPSDAAKDLVYVGVQGFAADGTTLVDRSGTTTATDAHWYCAAGVDMGGLSLNTWYTYTGYFQGWGTPNAAASTDADAPRAMHSSVRYIRPTFRLNAVGGNGTMELDYISLEVLTEGTEGNQLMKDAVNLGTGKIATNKVVEDSITANSITTNKIDAGAVTAAKISVTDLSAINATLGTITGGVASLTRGSKFYANNLTGSSNDRVEVDDQIRLYNGTSSALVIDPNYSAGAPGVTGGAGLWLGTTTGTVVINSDSSLDIDAGSTITVDGMTITIDASSGSLTLESASAVVLKYNTTTRINCNSTGIGFFGATPVAQPSAYTPSNVTPDRSFDADSILLAELADVVGTLISDLQNLGLIG